MKSKSKIIVFSLLALLLLLPLFSSLPSIIVLADSPNRLAVQLQSIGGGQASLTNNSTHTSAVAARLVIPSEAQQGSACMVLYPYNKTLDSLQSFQIYTSFNTAVPRFVILLDTTHDGLADVTLLSDYQLVSNGVWQLIEGGQRWGWTEASSSLGTYGTTWNSSFYWKSLYGNATVVFVGIALEYWAVKDSNGLNQALYADEIILNGVTYNIANALANETQPKQPTATDWTMYRQNLQRTGATYTAPNGSLLWRFYTDLPYNSGSSSSDDRLRSSPTVAGGVLYFGSNNTYYYALNATTGRLIWQVNVGSKVESSAAVADGVVYVGLLWNGQNGYVIALDAASGSVIWRFATNSGIESSPAVVNGVVYIGSYYGYVYALDAVSGRLIWSYLTGGSTYSSPAIVDGILYIGSIDGKVYALNTNDGTLLWEYQTGNPVYASPVVINGTIYVNTDNGSVYALRASNGSKIWQAYVGSGSDHADASPAVACGIVYVSARNGYYALNTTNGSQIWFFTSPYSPRQLTGYVYSSSAIAGGVAYYGSPDGYLFALNATNGTIVWSYRTGGFLFSSPAIANAAVYIGSYDGYVYAFGGSSALPPPAPSPSPTSIPTGNPTPTPTNTTTSAPKLLPNLTPNLTTTTPTPVPTVQSSPTPKVISSPTPTPSQVPTVQSNHEIEPMLAISLSEPQAIDWQIPTAIAITVIMTLASLLLIRSTPHRTKNYQ